MTDVCYLCVDGNCLICRNGDNLGGITSCLFVNLSDTKTFGTIELSQFDLWSNTQEGDVVTYDTKDTLFKITALILKKYPNHRIISFF
jgi:hypothetical protein